MKAQEKINKAKVKILQKSPFFSYLSLYLKFHEDSKTTDTIGVTPNGDCYYNTNFIENEINDEELLGVLAHEILHLALLHLTRVGDKNREGWNIATDLCINSMLKKEGFQLPKNGLIPVYDSFTFKTKKGSVTIDKINEKIAEQVYAELPIDELKGNGKGDCDCDSDEGETCSNCGKGFDEHLYDKGEAQSESEKAEQENEWLNRLNEASIHAQQRGKLPSGIERYVDKLKKAKINWKGLMNKYLIAQIPHDYTWAKRGKKSYATQIYMPDMLRESIDVAVAIDTSGSIGSKELSEFLTEIIGLANAYKSQINMRIITHDIPVHEDLLISNGNIDKIKELKCKGGGGTEHTQAFDYIKNKYPDTRCVISFTDGDSDLDDLDFNKYSFNKIFVINKDGNDGQLERKKCIKIHMRDY